MTKYQQFVQKWSGGCGSSLCSLAANKCFVRGAVPCDVLFCGESPGVSEDVLGVPFVGPAGQLLDKIVERSLGDLLYPGVFDENGDDVKITWCFTNLTLCFPSEQKKSGTNAPPNEAIEACAPRLREFIALAKPKLIVTVGVLAEKWVPKITAMMDKDRDEPAVRWCNIVHPAFILSKMNPAMQGLAVQRCVVAISDAIEELFQ